MTSSHSISRAPGTPRIAFVCDWCLPRFGGLELQLIDLARALRASGCHVEIVTTTPGPATVEDIPVVRLDGFRMPHFGFTCSPEPFRQLRSLLEARRYDVVHVQTSLIAPLAFGSLMMASTMGVPTAVTFHSVFDYLAPALRLYGSITDAASRPVAWSAVSHHVAREAQHGLGIPDGAIAILPNGVDPDFWNDGAVPHTMNGEFRLASVVRLQVRKRPHLLFEVVERAQALVGSKVHISLDIAGDGPERRRMDRLAAAGDARVRVHGRLDRVGVRALLARAHAFVLPTRMESFGIAALEARCAGVPVIALRETGVADFVTHGTHGLLADSVPELAQAVATLAQNPALRTAISDRNRSDRPPYDWQRVAALTLAEYDRARELQRWSNHDDGGLDPSEASRYILQT